jgi:hypothetical protein
MTRIGISLFTDAALSASDWYFDSGRGGLYDAVILFTRFPEMFIGSRGQCLVPEKAVMHCVISGWGGSPLDPTSPSVKTAIPAYKKIAEAIGHRAVLHVDPGFTKWEPWQVAKDVLSHLIPAGRAEVTWIRATEHNRIWLKHIADKFSKDPRTFNFDYEGLTPAEWSIATRTSSIQGALVSSPGNHPRAALPMINRGRIEGKELPKNINSFYERDLTILGFDALSEDTVLQTIGGTVEELPFNEL